MVRLIGADGQNLGVMQTLKALQLAQEQNLDLVEVAADGKPPVCKILDYGKERFKASKASKDKDQKQLPLKELQFSPGIADHDLGTKVAHARGFLEKGHRVTIILKFKGRQNLHAEDGMALLGRIAEMLQDIGKVESKSGKQGKQAVMLLAPLKK